VCCINTVSELGPSAVDLRANAATVDRHCRDQDE
jgi:hypothetical protein